VTGQRFSNKQMRDMERLAHLGSALLVAAVVYAPWHDSAVATGLVRFVVFPLLVGSGIAMWQLQRLRRWLRGRGGQPAGARR
jgi:thiosulfate reductase cytochrome b subunit